MSLYQCEDCGARENTALGGYWLRDRKICSECETGIWHGRFEKIILPLGMFITNKVGNLEHKETGATDLSEWADPNYKHRNVKLF